jgi:hypothetical protein
MRCRKTFAVLLAALLLFSFVVPAFGHNGLGPGWMRDKSGNHPWQDDNSHSGLQVGEKLVTFVIGPFVITVPIPFTKGDKDILNKNTTTTQKPKHHNPSPQKGE